MNQLVFIVIVAVLGNVAVESHRGPGRGRPNGPFGARRPPGPSGKHKPGPWNIFRERPPWGSSGEDSSGPNSSDCDSSSSSGPCSSEESGPKPGRGPCWGWGCPPTTTRAPKTVPPKTNTPWWETTPTSSHIWTLEPTIPWWETMTPTTTKKNTPSTKAWWETTPSPKTPKSTLPWWETSSPPSPSSPSSPSSSSKATPNWWDTTSSTSKSTPNGRVTPSPSTNSPSTNTLPWWETTTVNSRFTPSTTTTSSASTTLSADITECIKNCQSTNEYNPVCGTNGQTYNNMGKLTCAKTCGVNVDLKRKFACPPSTPSPAVTDSRESTNGRTAPTPSSPSWKETTRTAFDRCMIQCPVMPDYKPVCGTDLNTYINMDRLKCANTCGQKIKVLCTQPCGTCEKAVRRTTPSPTRPTTMNVARTDPPIASIEVCLKICPMSPTYQPVCGTNNVTYTNIGHMSCAQICGDDQVEIAYTGACGTPKTTTTVATTTSGVTVPPEMQEICMRHCPVTTEYNPVCGSDQVTYTNPGRLECAKLCGANVVAVARMPCNLINASSSTTQGFTGTTVSIDPDILFSLFGNGGSSTPPTRPEKDKVTPTATTAGFRTSPSSTVDFTLPPDIWSSIFDSNFTPSTKPTPDPDYYNDYIDPRFGNDDEARAYRAEFGESAEVSS